MMVLQWCVDIFNVIVEVWFGYWLFNVPKYRRFEQKWVRVLEYGCFIGGVGWVVLHDRMLGIRFSNMQTITIEAIFFLSTIIYTKQFILCSLAWSVIYFGTISLLELPGIVLSGWLIKQPYLVCANQPVIYDFFYLILLSFILLITYKKCGKLIRSYISDVITNKNAIIWIIFGIIEWWICTYFLIMGHTESGRDVFIYNVISIILILFLLVSVSVLFVYRRAELINQKRQIDEERRERIYDKIKDDYRRKSRELHDMKHQLQPLEGYLSLGQYDKALNYVRDLLGDISRSQNRIHGWTGNPLVDSLLDSKAEIALKQNIDIHIHASLLDILLSDKDTSVLLGNLLDNAIEASTKCLNKKWIDIYIIQKGKMLIIRVKNTYLSPPVEKQGKFESTKDDKSGHGWGLESVRAIVDSYRGTLDIKYDDKYFEVIIIFLGIQEDYYGKRY